MQTNRRPRERLASGQRAASASDTGPGDGTGRYLPRNISWIAATWRFTLHCFSVSVWQGPGRPTWYAAREMADQDEPQRGAEKGDADSTLLGVAPPRIDSSADSPQRSPVLVRSGTANADSEADLSSRVALPRRSSPTSAAATEAPPVPQHNTGLYGTLHTAGRYVSARPLIGMVLIPVVCGLVLVALARHPGPHRSSAVAPREAIAEQHVAPGAAPTSETPAAQGAPNASALSELERRPPGSLRARELITLAEAHDQQKRAAASGLREKLEHNPALAKEPATASQLLAWCADPSTAPEALLAMAEAGPTGADLLYEVWTSTVMRTDTTELARALLYSPDVRPHASAALGVALDLRLAESCEQYQTLLPNALKDGDRRSLHLLAKLTTKQGCGPKKHADCYACLRAQKDELSATINAVKSRRPPSFAAQ